ncbi:outer membrane lipoprotein-sorting protein [Dyadobacter jejuensis]|uniref:Outer membrane lipoprotein-sorting protein n=1 Tax=Dyadobacter jejuensis TaxID=1082580 RepID=A0A316B7G8_9BACT|nr:outer membrane lipoprotein carrier protein LolA [Dyadobacter jejuensis]PWJ58567.1 outer membrane lipoprotein-sorting protein [Dyadobacter jejuensis]
MYLKQIWIFGLLLLCLPSWAQQYKPAQNPQQLVAFLKASAQKTNTIEAKFTEEKQIALLKGTQKSSGVFYFKKKDRMRWEQRSPTSYTILINGDRVKIKDGTKQKSMEGGRMAQQIRSLILGLINGDFTEDKGFDKTYLENSTNYLVKLFPKNKRLKSVYKEISLLFNKKTGILEGLTFLESRGDSREMKFYDQHTNRPVEERLFNDF